MEYDMWVMPLHEFVQLSTLQPHEYLGEAQYQSYAAEFLRPASIDAEAVDAPASGAE